MALARRLHPDDVNGARDRWEVAIREKGDYLNEYRLRQADGTYRWYLAQAVAVRHPEAASANGWVRGPTSRNGNGRKSGSFRTRRSWPMSLTR